MKKYLVLILMLIIFIFFLSGCINNQPILSLSYVEWYTATEEVGDLIFGNVNLIVSGSTTGDKVTVITYGDGVIEEFELDLDQDKKFSQDIIIQFTHAADSIPRVYSTVLTAYEGNKTAEINLESEELAYL